MVTNNHAFMVRGIPDEFQISIGTLKLGGEPIFWLGVQPECGARIYTWVPVYADKTIPVWT